MRWHATWNSSNAKLLLVFLLRKTTQKTTYLEDVVS